MRRKCALLALLAALLLTGLAGRAARQGGRDTGGISFAVMGDTGSGDERQFATARRMARQREQTPYDFVLMLGDNIYNGGDPRLLKPRFEEPYRPLIDAGVKFYAVLGNHDVQKGTESQINYPHFNMGGRRYYSFGKGGGLIDFFGLDTNLMTGEQLEWFEKGLKESKARWKIVFCHHSLYTSARMHDTEVGLLARLEPLFTRYQVNVVFSGHSHVYERLKPQKGVHYITEGASGKLMKGNLDRRSPLTAAGNDQINSFLVVRVDEDEMKVRAIGSDGSLIDSATIKRDAKQDAGGGEK
jgi:predicted phosphodiesterase